MRLSAVDNYSPLQYSSILFRKRCLFSKKNNNFDRWRMSGILSNRPNKFMMKSISLSICILFCSVGFLIAGTTPGQETSLRRSLRKAAGTINTVETSTAPLASELPNAVQPKTESQPTSVMSSGKSVSGASLNTLANKSVHSKEKIKSGKGLGQFSLRNLWQAGKALKSYNKQSGFIQISITIFLFIVILLLIGMLLGVILNDLFIIFYIATALLLIWILLFMLGNLGIKKR